MYSGFWWDKDVIIKCGIEEIFDLKVWLDVVFWWELVLFDKFIWGIFIKEFWEMIFSFFKVNMGDLFFLLVLVG